jgi:hypothetical protein
MNRDKYCRIVFLGSALRRGPTSTRHDALAPSTAPEREVRDEAVAKVVVVGSCATHVWGNGLWFLVERYKSQAMALAASQVHACGWSVGRAKGARCNGGSLSFPLGRKMTDHCLVEKRNYINIAGDEGAP